MTERTNGNRPDYKELHTTGKKVVQQVSSVRSRNKDRKSNIEVDNVTNFFESLNIESTMDGDTGSLLGIATGGGDHVSNINKTSTDEVGSSHTDEERQRQMQEENDRLSQQVQLEQEERLLREKLQTEKEERLQWMTQFKDDENQAVENNRLKNIEETQLKVNELISQAESISDDIDDFIDENPSYHFGNSIEDLDKAISRIEDLRSAFRARHKELKNHCRDRYGESLHKAYSSTLDVVKEYLKMARDKRKSLLVKTM